MIFTLAWKEVREHQGIWITMVFLSVFLGLGLAKIVSINDAQLAAPVAALTILGLAATYGAVCGSMMFAGEHESGTLPFLDIFLGRRGLLWAGKCAIGVGLVLTQALAVALVLHLLRHEPPDWLRLILGLTAEPRRGATAPLSLWFLVLPLVTMEAFLWGLLGSSLTTRVLNGAALAAVGFTPVMLLSLCAPAEFFLVVRLLAAGACLVFSCWNFLRTSEPLLLMTAAPAPPVDRGEARKDHFLDLFDEIEREEVEQARTNADVPVTMPVARPARADHRPRLAPPPPARDAEEDEWNEARSPGEVLWWLTLKQAWPVLGGLAAASLVFILLVAFESQVHWPLAGLLLGVACGATAFAPEQRDLSYQFLAAQHFPLKVIWRFKVLFWLGVLTVTSLAILGGALLIQLAQNRVPFRGSLRELLGPWLFFGVWLAYGFSIAQVVVWLCRKTILALLLSGLASLFAVSFWLPSLLCGGMSGWQVWLPPLLMLTAGGCLMRAWAGGRIWERRPFWALVGFVSAALVWSLLVFGYRAVEIPEVGPPQDPLAYKATLPAAQDNVAGRAILLAVTRLEEQDHRWLAPMAKQAHAPLGVIEAPRGLDGQQALLNHLPGCEEITRKLLARAGNSEPDLALDYLSQILALSRHLRHKAVQQSYVAGVQTEELALTGLGAWLARGKPDPKSLQRVLDELHRHAQETPAPLDCVQTECFRSNGALANPAIWTFAAPGPAVAGKVREPWVASGIALALEMPWEAERAGRLWRLVWSGLFRAAHTPYWQWPQAPAEVPAKKDATRTILQGWLPATEGPGAGITPAAMAEMLDASWLADEKLFCDMLHLRDIATRARWRVDGSRLAVALALYQMEAGQPARDLQALVPRYFAEGVPGDPYSGQPIQYRLAPEAAVWSIGPEAALITKVPHWP